MSLSARYAWAMLLLRIYEVLPLVCPRCGGAMRILALVTGRHGAARPRAPGGSRKALTAVALAGAAGGVFAWDGDSGVDQRTAYADEPW